MRVAFAWAPVACALLVVAAFANPGGAQTPRQEFVVQTLVLTPFPSAPDPRLGARVADDLRDALRANASRRALGLVTADSTARMLRGSGFLRPEDPRESDVVWVARIARGDEVLVGAVSNRGDSIVVQSTLILVRDPRMREPLPTVRAVGRGAAATALARAVQRARLQADPVRRCENAARAGDGRAAIREAERALQSYPEGLWARHCLLRVLASSSVSRDSVLDVASAILRRDSTNIIAATIRAQTLQASGRQANATTAWQRVISLRPDSLDLATEAVEQLLRLSRPRETLLALDTLHALHPTENRLRRQRFRALHTLARWPEAAALGDSLEQGDPFFSGDPNFALRYVEALKMRGDTLRAVAKSAKSVVEYPQDGRLYVQYVELISGESAVALTRGLTQFPSLSALRVLAAQQARASGDVGRERAALSAALSGDGVQAPVYLRLADLWLRDSRPDSALALLAAAPREGDGAMLLRTFLVGRGVQLLRTAVDSQPDSYGPAVGFLALADSLDSQEDSRRLVVAVALQQARAHLVVGAATRGCDPIQRASASLIFANTTLSRGVGEGSAASELVEAYGGLQTAVDDAQRLLCASGVP